jgi:hypothetical protein
VVLTREKKTKAGARAPGGNHHSFPRRRIRKKPRSEDETTELKSSINKQQSTQIGPCRRKKTRGRGKRKEERGKRKRKEEKEMNAGIITLIFILNSINNREFLGTS